MVPASQPFLGDGIANRRPAIAVGKPRYLNDPGRYSAARQHVTVLSIYGTRRSCGKHLRQWKPDKWNPGQNHFSDYVTTQELATRLKKGEDAGVSSTERQPSLMMIFLVCEWPFRVFALHLDAFFRRQLRQMPNEEDQFPVVLRSMRGDKARHASEADSVFDDPE